MTGFLVALALVSAAGELDTGVVFTSFYEMTGSDVRQIQEVSGHWYSPGERLVPFRKDKDGGVTVRTTWSGYRGRFIAHITVDSGARIQDVRWIEKDGRIYRTRRRQVHELENMEFLRQYIGQSLDELADKRSALRSPRVRRSPNPTEFRNLTTAMMVEALVIAGNIE